jgi:hypothetical protein
MKEHFKTQLVKRPFICMAVVSKKKHGTIFIFKLEIIRIWCTGPLNRWRSDNKVSSWASERGTEV